MPTPKRSKGAAALQEGVAARLAHNDAAPPAGTDRAGSIVPEVMEPDYRPALAEEGAAERTTVVLDRDVFAEVEAIANLIPQARRAAGLNRSRGTISAVIRAALRAQLPALQADREALEAIIAEASGTKKGRSR